MTGTAKNNNSWHVVFPLFLLTVLLWSPTTVVAGQAMTLIEIQKPAPGETLTVEAPKNTILTLMFDAQDAQIVEVASDLVLLFTDNGRIVLRDFLVRDDLETIDFSINGTIVSAQVVVDQIQAVTTVEDTHLETAAGEDSGGDSPLPNLSGLRHTGRDLLFPGEFERDGHPLYSYLLFAGASEGSREEHARFKSAIEAYVGQVRSADALESSGAVRASINIFYAPLKPIFIDTKPTSMRLHFAQRTATEQIDILSRLYDHARAEVLMGQVQLRGNGPFIVSVLRPLSEKSVGADEAFLVQDLSGVPPKLVALWVDEFKRQVVREATDSPEHLRRFALSLRTQISVLAEGFAITKSAVAEMFETPKASGEDGN
ncbi:hypothetical protein [Pelagibius sp. Alg239-R121]|uniref:hypothetical protein n=1 Tax=Pelagibius sp. Alg239-R121 TaxID=2993448 RepID=UPI0024A66188|nr:hypothetical protein [Pelagibius sp. Alg239-R121]